VATAVEVRPVDDRVVHLLTRHRCGGKSPMTLLRARNEAPVVIHHPSRGAGLAFSVWLERSLTRCHAVHRRGRSCRALPKGVGATTT
jgi:hypothetical protein